ncbi:beta-ketoacyl synthase N-terminal-like domain-containing protein [Micromonospora haikouensis]|uniref:beta-ketoacyl synthase N-terminal-like domain-containing protein n=1 Tax=Micromonospora haikouensis TaxID=686309 RepID=UPI0037A5E2E5
MSYQQTNRSGVEYVPLSADSEERLREYAADLAEHLRAVPEDPADVTHTLRVGREARRWRAVIDAGGLDDILAGLDAIAAGRDHPRVRRARVNPADTPPETPGDAAEAARRWLTGTGIDWLGLAPPGVRRLTLPVPAPCGASDPAPAGNAAAGLSPQPGADPGTAPTARPAVDPAARQRALDVLFALYAEVSGFAVDELRPDVPTDRYGLTSAQIVDLNARLAELTGPGLPPTLFFRNATLGGVADDLSRLPGPWSTEPERHAPTLAAESEPVPVPASASPPTAAIGPAGVSGPTAELAPADADSRAIAVIGLAGRYPDAPNLDTFWRNLRDGHDAVRQVPADRGHPTWAAERMWGGFLDDVAHFDPGLFGITPRDASRMDPQERLFLECVWEALEDAGHPRSRLRDRHGGRVGVFAGSMYNEYPFFGVERTLRGEPTDAGSAIGGIANRVSFHLDLVGPSLTVDTLCSSSLVAIDLAVRALRHGECEVAIAGAVNLSLHPNKFIQQERMKLTASGRRCRSFGAGGDGFVPSEGVGVVVLKPLSRALADGDPVHGVIRGTATLHMGRTSGWIVPNPTRQGELVRAALADAGTPATSIGYVEAHGAGTALGDPVEIEGLLHAYGDLGLAPGAVPIGAVKSNIGHVEAAAGIAGLTKVLLQMRHRTLVPSLHADPLNDRIDWNTVPFRVQRTAEPWPEPAAGGPRRAGVSSFGAGGMIAHLVVEEPPAPPARQPAPPGPQVVVLSAADRSRLAECEKRLLRHLEDDAGSRPEPGARVLAALRDLAAGAAPAGLDLPAGASPAEVAAALLRADHATDATALADLAYTTQLGREPLRERVAFVVDDLVELRRELRARVDGSGDRAFSGTAGRGGSEPVTPAGAAGREQLADLARRWVDGTDVDWRALHEPGTRRLVPLPSYPFARVRCWLPDTPPAGVPLYEQVYADAGPVTDTGAPRPGVTICVYPPSAEALVAELGRARTCGELLPVRWGGASRPDGPVRDLAVGDDHAGAVRAAGRLLAEHPGVDGLLDLCDLADRPASGSLLPRTAMLQQLMVHRRGRALRVLHVTRGLDAAHEDAVGFAAVVATVAADQRGLRATTVDVDEARPAALAAAWAAEASRARVRAGRLLVMRLAPVDAPRAGALDPRAWYLVTGAGRGIGARVARHLADRGARRIALLGVRALDGTVGGGRMPDGSAGGGRVPDGAVGGDRARLAAEVVHDLRRRGATVRVHTGALDDAAGLAAFLDGLRADGPIRGLVHCAGRTGGAPRIFAHQGALELRAMTAPKLTAWLTLAQALRADTLDFAVAFSSIAAVSPVLARGGIDYAAANAALDLCGTGSGFGSATRTIAWPMWAQSGQGTGAPNVGDRIGVAALDDSAALDVLDRVAALPRPVTVVPLPGVGGAAVDPAKVLAGVDEPAPAPASASTRPTTAAAALPVPPAATVAGEMPLWLVELVARITGNDPAELDVDRDFGDLGIESVMLADVLAGIEQHVGRSLEPALLIENPTVRRLAEALAREGIAVPTTEERPAAAEPVLSAAVAPPVETAAPPVESAAPVDGGVAVIGLAVRVPGANDPDTFWANLVAGRSAVGEVPPSRWDVAALYDPAGGPGRSISRSGGFIDGLEEFDAAHFGMSAQEARDLDPAIRLVLESAAECLDDAGYRPEELAGRRVATVVGGRVTGYVARAGISPAVLQTDANFMAAQVAQRYDFRGPALVVDSACSSALLAVHTAVRGLLAGDADVAFVAGVEVLLDERPYLEFTAARAISPSGRCATFDASADGFVPGEGCVGVLLKPLARALADGDRIHAVIEGSAVNNDGQTMGVTTPNPAAQADVVRRALRAAGRRPDEIGMIEAHGTATPIGDPIELRALTDVFGAAAVPSGSCAVGSVKSGIGHLLNAAGLAGLAKGVLAVERGVIPPTLNCPRPNPRFDFAASPFFPVREPTGWRPGRPRVAGVSSFGLGGTNAHVVVAEPPDAGAHPPRRAPRPRRVWQRERLWHDRPGVPAPRTSLLDLTIRRSRQTPLAVG